MITQKERFMSHQLTFADSDFSNKRRKTRKIQTRCLDVKLPKRDQVWEHHGLWSL